ncbi:hypothetical protein BC940DRAFT_173845 [Gongronella butleri]|nr:hypothetical protein BC940DRAFT_173845 [Gongronella butleri]
MLEPDNGLDEQREQLEQTFSDIGLDDERPAQAVKSDGGVKTAFSDEKELSQVDDRRQDEHDTQTTAVHTLPTAGEGASGSSVHLTADHLLDDLDGSKEAATGPLAQTVAARQTSHYDQFFEEVSLDLPRDSYMPAAGKTTRFPYLPRGRGMSATATASTSTPTTASSGSPHAKDMAITSADISGPFYSISDVLDDSAIDHPADDYIARGAQRNIYEQNIVVTSGGANLTGIQRRSSLNLFSRPRRSQKPSPLETVVSKTRPRMLPPKDPSEEKKHLQQHEALMKKARKLEEKKVKEHERKKEQVDKRVAQAISVWEHTILPQWDQKIKEKKTHDLWRQGVPPRCRRNVWMLAIGNHLQLSKESFVGCLREVPLGPTNGHAAHETPASTRRRIVEDQENSFYQQKRRTSSLHVLHENEDEDVSLASGPTASSDSLPMARGSLDHATPASPGGATTDDGSDMQNVDLDDLGDQHSVLGRASMAIEDDTVDDDDNDDAKYSPTGARTNTGAFIHDTTTLAYLRKAVDEDILRTLPSLCVFQPEGPLFVSLRKVLHAYIGYRADANYVRNEEKKKKKKIYSYSYHRHAARRSWRGCCFST